MILRKKILVIGYVWPEPTSSAAGSRMMTLLTFFLERKCSITYATPAAQSEHKVNLESLGIKETSIQVNDDSFDEFIKKENPDFVLFDRFMMEEQFGWRVNKFVPDAVTLLDTEDLHSLRKARQKAWKEKRVFQKEDLFDDIAKREIASIYRCDLTLIISEYEMELLKEVFQVPEQILFYLPFLIEEKEIDLKPFEDRKHFMTIGNFLHEPNWNAVLYLKEEIWPLIRKSLPKAELHVYGAYPSQKVLNLHHQKTGFFIKGRAENARDVMESAKVCLAPLRFGAGLKGKLIEAMEMGTPSVTTSIGAEGMHGEMQWNGCIEDDALAFAEKAILLHQDEEFWKQASHRGNAILQERFNRTNYLSMLNERFTSLLEGLESHRFSNFTGQMLKHHSLKSTEYMSRWITEKNKKV